MGAMRLLGSALSVPTIQVLFIATTYPSGIVNDRNASHLTRADWTRRPVLAGLLKSLWISLISAAETAWHHGSARLLRQAVLGGDRFPGGASILFDSSLLYARERELVGRRVR
jgi:hypothetical protein